MQDVVCRRPSVVLTLVRRVQHVAMRVAIPGGSGGRALSHAGRES